MKKPRIVFFAINLAVVLVAVILCIKTFEARAQEKAGTEVEGATEKGTPDPIRTPHGRFYPYVIKISGAEYIVVIGPNSCSVCPAFGKPEHILEPGDVKEGGL